MVLQFCNRARTRRTRGATREPQSKGEIVPLYPDDPELVARIRRTICDLPPADVRRVAAFMEAL